MTATPDPLDRLATDAATDLLGGREARTVSAERARHVCDRLAHQAAAHGASALLFALRTSDQAAADLGLTRRAVQALARRRNIGWRIGRDVLFRPEDIAAMRDRAPGPPTRG